MIAYIPQPIPFFGNLNRTIQGRRACASLGTAYVNPVVVGTDTITLPTMQVKTLPTQPGADVFRLIDSVSLTAIDLDETSWSAINTPDGNGALYFEANTITATGVEPGRLYWLEVSNGVDVFYSNQFYTVAAWPGTPECAGTGAIPYVRVKWRTVCPIVNGGQHDLTQYDIYLEGEPGQPSWELKEEGGDDVDGGFSADFQRIEKTLSLEFFGTADVADCLAHLPLYEDLKIEFSDGEVWPITKPSVEVAWTDACTGRIVFKFQVDPLVRQGCAADCE